MNASIRCICLDVDGVLTDGGIYTDADGGQLRRFHVYDGLAIRWFMRTGGVVIILSGKDVPAVGARARELGIEHVIQGSDDKLGDLRAKLAALGLTLAQTSVVGDDLPDVRAMRACGFPIAVANAMPAVRSVAKYVTAARGGQGAVREAIEHLMRMDGRWAKVIEHYGAEEV